MRLILSLLAFSFCTALAAPPPSKDEGRIIINADSMKRLASENAVQLKGHVQIAFGDHSLTCDEALIRQSQFEVEARGNVILVTPAALMSGDRLTMNYKDKTGVIYNGIIKMDQVIFEGDIINKKGEREFEAISADYTACTTCPPAWGFSGSKIEATLGGYAHIRNPILRVVKVPILWLPYLIVPLNTKRQTGFLFPGWSFSDLTGFGYSQPFFWAISQNTDATLTAKYWTRRGLKGLVDYRYVLTPESHGEADVGYIRDNLLTSSDSFFKYRPEEGKPINRWHFKYSHKYSLPYDYTHRMDIKAASDLRYPRDFGREFAGWGDSAIDNRMSLTKNTEGSHASVDASYYTNLLKEDPLANNTDSVHRFPEVRYSLSPKRMFDTPLLFQLETRYNNFARESYAFDDRIRTADGKFVADTSSTDVGVYNPNSDLIRTGQRLDLIPRVSLPMSLGPYIDLLPSVALRETDYQFPLNERQSAQRRLLRTDLSLRTRFSRIFGDQDDPYATRYRHEIVPEITQTSIPWVERSSHPFFGARDEESYFTANTALGDADENKQFDYHDRLYERNLFTFSLSNYLIRKRWVGGAAEYGRIALFRLSQSFDYYEYVKTVHPTQPYSDIYGLLDVRLDWFETNTTVRYYPYQNVSTASSRVKLMHPARHFIESIYSQDYQIIKGERVNIAARTEDLTTKAGIFLSNVGITGKSTYSFVTRKHRDYGYVLTLQPPGNCWFISFGQERTEKDLVYTFNASFLFDGKTAVDSSSNSSL